uniref:Uncharacterized protein n=1 Tax=Tanacetum cinerariifolium TaxID=118510 RepID=A0A699IT00_TANCI|nr:hypothetical protein [Tanacetum cinerariifolium]GEZ89826.1 hypothetical protein [Tanacetum cinerariifolium]
MEDTISQTRFENVSKQSNDSYSQEGRRIDAINADEYITLVNDTDNEMFDVNALDGEEMFVARQNENFVEEIVDPKKKDQIKFDEEAAKKLQAEFDEEERLAREKAKKEQEANISLIETWDDIQARIDVDHQLAKRLQAQEQQELEDLEDLYKLVKARYGSTRPVENMDYLLWSDMKTMFEQYVECEIQKMQQGYKVFEWKLYDSCGVHSLMMRSMQIYMLVEKKYPLTPPTLSMILEKKLQIDYESEMATVTSIFVKKTLCHNLGVSSKHS